ncbi:MAG: GGDEF domain-containing protein [Chloroflexaceae bacterium]
MTHLHRAMTLLTAMSRALQSCTTSQDIAQAALSWLAALFPGGTGTLSLRDPRSAPPQTVVTWGTAASLTVCPRVPCRISPGCCDVTGMDNAVWFPTCSAAAPADGVCLCVPVQAHGEQYGTLRLARLPAVDPGTWQEWICLAEAAATHLAWALTYRSMQACLAAQAIRDPLTGLFHRGYLETALQHLCRHAAQVQQPFSLILLDIDHFKPINDTYGHPAGDLLLRMLGAHLQAYLRDGDIACRYGGDEFTLLVPDTTLHAGHQYAETLRRYVQQRPPVQYQGQTLPPISLSLGVAGFPDHGRSGAALLSAADQALYQAKAAGRSQVAIAATPAGTV